MAVIKPRTFCDINGTNGNCTFSTWDIWGRWVAFGVIIVVAVLILLSVACFNARRRRNRGLRPYPGTSWMAPPPGSPPPEEPCYSDPDYEQNPPPQYTTNSQSYGYFGSQSQPQQEQEGQEQEGQEGEGQLQPQTEGIELQTPPAAYRQGGQHTYALPPSPPPNKE